MSETDDRYALTLQEQLRADLLQKIENGSYAPGDQLPSESELVEAYGVSRVTVRAALRMLVDEGVLVKRRGKGTFVRPTTLVESALTSGSFTETCLEMGLEPATHVFRTREIPADPAITSILSRDDEALIEIRRLRMAGATPCIVEHDYFPLRYRFLMQTELENRSLFEILKDEGGRSVCGFEDRFRIARADAECAELLGVAEGEPLLEVLETVYGNDATDIIYVNRQLIASERYLYVVRSRKG